jgi:Tol biopolymer transport system component
MPLNPGARLGPYEVTGAIGAGGMGAVYRARDTRLHRDVALKVLPDLFASDPERLARFTREAQVLAALNHPNIAHIHGLEELPASPGQPTGYALVMEFVDGEELTANIARGPMPVVDAVAIVVQIAAALEAAHEQGIVHRDLKPANVKLRPDGTVKVLDFGLAKALAPEGTTAAAEAMNSPTLTARATAMGMIIGTAAYMAPEQAKGRAVDRRADIWAFGVVFYELLTGQRAFDGEDVSTTLAAVLMKDPAWSALPADTPEAVRTLLRRCLERDPKQRLRDIGEARILLNSSDALRGSAPVVAPLTIRASRLPWLIAAAAVIAAVMMGASWAMSSGASPADRIETSLAPLKAHAFAGPFALSPDGRRLVAPMEDDDTGVTSLYVRDLSGGQPVEIPHTEGGLQPFWSPDSREIAFFAEGKLKRVDLLGGSPQVLCDAPSPRGGAWGPDNLIIFAGSFRKGLEKIDARGGKPADLTTVDVTKKEKSHRWPAFLPGAADILFLAQTGEAGAKDDASTIEVLTVATGARTRLVGANSAPLYSTAGFLLFWREGALRAQAFNASARTISGDVFVVANDVSFDTNERPMASIAGSGTLVYESGLLATSTSLLVVDRSGKPAKTIVESAEIYGDVALSHDGTRVAASVYVKGTKDAKIWLYDLTKDTARPVTFGPGNDLSPIWLEDDSALAYTNDLKNDGTIFRRLADGRGESQEIVSTPSGLWTWQWSKDGKWLVAGGVSGPTGRDIFRVDTSPAKVAPLVNSTFIDDMPSLSPDNRWLAYVSDETGRSEVYVRPLSGEGRWVVSSDGGGTPMWRRDGRELYFLTPQRRLMAVQVEPVGEAFHFGAPAQLFRADFSFWDAERVYAPFSDGKRFVIKVEPRAERVLLTLVTNWRPASPR